MFKKILSGLTVLTISVPTTMTVVACSNKSNDQFSGGDSWDYLEAKHNVNVIAKYEFENDEIYFYKFSKANSLEEFYSADMGF